MTNPMISAVLDALKNNPAEWHFTEYRATNRNRGIDIWIGNGLYGLDVNGYGSVTVLSCFFGWLIPWRLRVWRAVWRAKATQIRGAA
ncbi:hypothetical protein L3V16_15640 [Brucella ciceri]|uniref:hypothetical protein n=1 Tax=Brucella ciceri TaxID=391287 RepID=UPI001F13544A|nr:hypothetical protein [Brucella ciceri]MCH6205269.1 hypothetical protein [Brucella ciceri]